jgi:hypothetical protein
MLICHIQREFLSLAYQNSRSGDVKVDFVTFKSTSTKILFVCLRLVLPSSFFFIFFEYVCHQLTTNLMISIKEAKNEFLCLQFLTFNILMKLNHPSVRRVLLFMLQKSLIKINKMRNSVFRCAIFVWFFVREH